MNVFRATGELSSGVAEIGVAEVLNNKVGLEISRAYGLITCQAMEADLYYALGNLPELE